MKVHPRLEIDITFKDLSFNLLSTCLFAQRRTIIKSIQSYWLMHRLRSKGFDPTTGATSLKAIGSGSIQAKQLINSVLYLPISASLPATEIVRLARSISLSENGIIDDALKDSA